MSLKLFTAYYIQEHDELTNTQKIEALTMLKEMSEDKVLSFVTESPDLFLDPNDFAYLLEGFEDAVRGATKNWMKGKSDFEVGQAAGLAKAGELVSTVAIVALALKAAHIVYKEWLSKSARACKGKTGAEKQQCEYKFKVKSIQAQMAALNKGKSKCKQTKDPKKCALKIDSKILKLKAKIQKIKF